MQKFDQFKSGVIADRAMKMKLTRQIQKRLEEVPAVSLMGSRAVGNLADNITDISLEICLSIFERYHAWNTQQQNDQ